MRILAWSLLPLLLHGFLETRRVRLRRFELALPHLPPEAEGLRVLQVSDLHVGLWMPRALLSDILGRGRAQQPDLVVFTGDVVTRPGSYLPPLRPLARPLLTYAGALADAIKDWQPPQGKWLVPGNHDLWEGDFEPIAAILARSGVSSLVNRSVRLSCGLPLVGVDDLRVGRPDVRTALAGIGADEAQLILNHNPRLTMLLRERNALILAGHTHGGQMRAPRGLRPAPVDSRFCEWIHGLYRVGRARLYVSSGAGTIGLPLRFGVPPEIVLFTLRAMKR